MPCDTVLKPNQTLAERNREIDAALARLEAYLTNGVVSVGIGMNGAITFDGWKDRDGLSDVCAYRTLTNEKKSWALRQAILKAERKTGRKVNPQAVASGLHSHDGGKTWSRH